MATSPQEQVLDLLKKCGAAPIFSRKHLKFRLPNGHVFVAAKTPSDYDGQLNSLTQLRRELKSTHPDLCYEGRSFTLSKPKRAALSLGELMIAQGIVEPPPSPFDTTPAYARAPLVTYVPSSPEQQAEERPIHHAPRKPRHEPTALSGAVRTLTAEQLAEANRLLASEGQQAMDRYLDQCRNGLVVATPEIARERVLLPHPSPFTEDHQMSNILERAKEELAATVARIAAHQNRIDEIKALEEKKATDEVRAEVLRGYIAKHESLAKEATELLGQGILPEQTAPPAKSINIRIDGRANGAITARHHGFGMAEVRQRIFPWFRQQHIHEFGGREIARGAVAVGLLDAEPSTVSNFSAWLFAACGRKVPDIEKAPGAGLFRFVESSNGFVPSHHQEAAPAEAHHHG